MAAFSSPSPGPNPIVDTQPSVITTPLQVDVGAWLILAPIENLLSTRRKN